MSFPLCAHWDRSNAHAANSAFARPVVDDNGADDDLPDAAAANGNSADQEDADMDDGEIIDEEPAVVRRYALSCC